MLDFNNKYVQCGIKSLVVAIGLLAVFLLSKTITEIVSWSDSDGMYPAKTITVSAQGEAIATSDIASFSFSVNEEGATSAEATNKATEKTEKALDYLKENGVEDKDIKTEYYNINPKYEMIAPCYAFDCPPQKSEIVGYEVSQGIRVKVRDTENAGKFLGELTGFGINNVSGLSFTIDDEDTLFDEARTNAIEKAKAQAEELADDLGVRLGKIVTFYEDSPAPYYGGEYDVMSSQSKGEMAPRAVSIPVGENTYTKTVSITYEIK